VLCWSKFKEELLLPSSVNSLREQKTSISYSCQKEGKLSLQGTAKHLKQLAIQEG
jgi:hypothetical protein